jgi:hypothetical protein
VTTLTEKRSSGDTIAGFLVVVAALVAWRGAARAPVASVIAGLFALVTIAGWLYWRRRPPSELEIGPDAIVWGSRADAVIRIERGPSGLLQLRRSAARQTAWSLTSADDASAGIPLIGFDPGAVRDACVTHGWRFDADR